ncbi:hypothetical protein VP1G_02898 [Cytospora mali]|uniref:LCCL domain-containing protein n=1 Tax=Cytospora mali TaxID=578113 RepID=A0A194UVH4_CYTMA|nr:hypothetical protein VP1G_02898 [Valsa mali var. pyri (nom. inval.)]
MAVSKEPQGIERGTRQTGDAIIDENQKSATSRTELAEEDATGRRDANRDQTFIDRLTRRVPPPIQNKSNAAVKWLRGPDPPQVWKIRPYLPRLQQLPLRLADKFFPRQWQRLIALFVFYVCWIVTFAAVLHKSSVVDDVDGYGSPVLLECGSTFWSENNECGLDGTYCEPFANSSFAFRCPASCTSEEVLNPRYVGAQEVIYQTLVVGGPTDKSANGDASGFMYRGDSFICPAAIHAGIVSNVAGGCGVVSLIGQQSNYPSVARNGISSVGFDSSFPSSFTFAQGSGVPCRDLRWQLLAVSVVYTTLLSLFTRSPSIFFYSIVIGCYLQAALATDIPEYTDVYTLVSTAMGKLLPVLFIVQVMYRLYIRRTLLGLTAQLEKTVLWLGPCWVATLADYTFELIPLQRLTGHDIDQQPGAIASLVVIVLVIFFIFVGQAWAFRREARLLRYLVLYVCLGVIIGLLAAIPHEDLRIHHYILGLLLLPGTSIQTRPSLVYQGILVGLFINGVAKWGFDSILQTAAELQGDAILGTALPTITALNVTSTNITFSWPGIPDGYNGTSVLVNDVERQRIGQEVTSFTWQRLQENQTLPEYFRFAFYLLSAAYGMETGDYTKAGTWFANGTWEQMKTGAS